MTKISVIVPVYNVELYLGECLNSLLGQTCRDIEVICVDDGSTDSSPDLLRRYALRDRRVRVVRQENAGAGVARNTGIEQATGKYLFFCDPDDWTEATMLESFYEKAEATQADVVIASILRFDSATRQNAPHRKAIPRSVLEKLDSQGAISSSQLADELFVVGGNGPCNKFFRHSLIAEKHLRFQPLRRTNDLFFVNAALASSSRIAFIDYAFYHYRRGIDSATTNDSLSESFCIACEALKSWLTENDLFDRYAATFRAMAFFSFAYNFKSIADSAFRVKWYAEICPRVIALVQSPVNLNVGGVTKWPARYIRAFDAMVAGKDAETVLGIMFPKFVASLSGSTPAANCAQSGNCARSGNDHKRRTADVKALEHELDSLKRSFAYRTGLVLTKPLRFIYRRFMPRHEFAQPVHLF